MSNTDRLAVGVDIGGSKIAFALVDAQGNVQASHRAATNAQDGADAVLDAVVAGIDHLCAAHPNAQIVGVGVGCPGLIDAVAGVVRFAVNLNWHDVPLKAGLEARLAGRYPVSIANDVQAAALGEMRFGAGRGVQNLAYFAVGTGFGSAAVVDGRLLRGANNLAMEIGQIENVPEWGDQANGHIFEHYTSGSGMLKLAEWLADADSPHYATTFDILTACENGEPFALKIVSTIGEWLGRAAVWVATILNPEVIVIGGGMGHAAHQWLIPQIESALASHTHPFVRENLQILMSELSDPAIGAASLVW